jgi:hypothetical protein
MDTDPDALSELKNDLRVTTENIEADARRLAEIEAEKARLQPGDPRLDELGREAEGLAERMATTTKVESALISEAQSHAGRPD